MAITLDNRALVTIYGGSGFIGRHVVGAIAKTGARMRVAVRRPELAGHLQPLGGVGQINAVQANVRYPESLLAAARGADAVINLVGILFPTGKQTPLCRLRADRTPAQTATPIELTSSGRPTACRSINIAAEAALFRAWASGEEPLWGRLLSEGGAIRALCFG